MEGRWLILKKTYIEYYTRIFNYPLESRVKTKEDLDTLGIKTFSVQMYAVLIEDQSMMQWEASSIKAIFKRGHDHGFKDDRRWKGSCLSGRCKGMALA